MQKFANRVIVQTIIRNSYVRPAVLMTESVFLSPIAVSPAFRRISLFAVFSRKGAAVHIVDSFCQLPTGMRKLFPLGSSYIKR